MRKFFIRLIYFLCIPVFVLGLFTFFYIKRDVYLDFGYHRNYSWKYYYQSLGDISTKKLLHASTNYNSFILGSSRTVSLYACYIQKKIKDARAFHYANWDETVGGMYAKLKLLDARGYRLSSVFIYFDTDYTFAENGQCKDYDHYLLTNENKFAYYINHYLNFLPPQLDNDKTNILIGRKVNTAIFPDYESDLITNDSDHECSDSIISNYGKTNFDSVYNKRIDSLKASGFLFKRSREEQFKEKQISIPEQKMLEAIRDILEKHKSRYYIVITPLYDQLKFDKSDMKIIRDLFGKNVYDFSGINSITDNEYNYPDRKHFLPYISKNIIDSITAHTQ